MKDNRYDFFNFIDLNTPSIGLGNVLEDLNLKLSTDAKLKIKEANLYLFCSIGPGCITKVRLEDSEVLNRLIVIDKTLTYDLLKFSIQETAAELLHEVGHFLNSPDKADKDNEEFYADDFARMLGYGLFLMKSFEKYLTIIEANTDEVKNKYFFADKSRQTQIVELLKKRLKRIQNNDPFFKGTQKIY